MQRAFLAAALLAFPAVQGGAVPDLVAGRERLRRDAAALDDPMGVESVSWPSHGTAAKASASLIREAGVAAKKKADAESSARWVEMRGLVDGLEQDSKVGLADPAFARVVGAERQVAKAEAEAKAQADAKKAAAALRSERITAASDLDLASATHAIDDSSKQMHQVRGQSLDWGMLKHAESHVLDSNSAIREHLWEQKTNRELDDFRTQVAEQTTGVRANIKADSGIRALKIEQALEAKARFDELHAAAGKMPAARAPPKAHGVAFLGTAPGQAGGSNLAWVEDVTKAVEPAVPKAVEPAAPQPLGLAMRDAVHDTVAKALSGAKAVSAKAAEQPSEERIEDKREDDVAARVEKESSLNKEEEPARVPLGGPEAEADDVAVRQAPPPPVVATKVQQDVPDSAKVQQDVPESHSGAMDHAFAGPLALLAGFVVAGIFA